LKASEESLINDLCESIITSSEKSLWTDKLEACVENSENIESLDIINRIQQLSLEYDLDLYSSALLYHSDRRK
jgi:hypothetical protein